MVCRFDPSTNRGFRDMYAVSIGRGWRLGAEGENVRAGIRCEGLSEKHEREEDASGEIVRHNAACVERDV